MPTRRHQFYDPIIQTGEPEPIVEPEPELIRAILVERPGVFFHVDDIVSILSQAEGLLAALDYFRAVSVPDEEQEEVIPAAPFKPDTTPAAEPTVTPDTSTVVGEVPGAADPHPEVARVEVFPDADGRWHARPVDAEGTILDVTNGSFDRSFVEADAFERWPGKELFELGDAMGDSIWDEQPHPFGWNGRRRPSPKRLWVN